MAIETEESGLTKGDQTANLIACLHEEIETLKRQRDWYFKAWKQAERDLDRHLKGLPPLPRFYG